MLTEIGCIPEPTHYPMAMARYGLSPYGKPLYRVVFADSVRCLSGRTWPDGATEYRAVRTYPQFKGQWIIERWLPARHFTGMSKDMYEVMKKDPKTGLYPTGPYPAHGEYWLVGDDALKDPSQGGIERLIRQAEWCYQHPNQDGVTRAAEDASLSEEAARDEWMLQTIKECRPSFGQRPTSFAGHVHSVKSHVSKISANKLNLPTRHGMHVGRF